MSTSNCAFINGLVAQVFYIDAKRQFHAYVATRPANYEKEMLNLLVKSLEICFVSSTLNYDHQFLVISNEMRTTNGFSSLSLSLSHDCDIFRRQYLKQNRIFAHAL